MFFSSSWQTLINHIMISYFCFQGKKMQWRRYCANAPLRRSSYYSRYSYKSIENLEITRKTCSTVFFMFLLAVSGSIASSRVVT